MGFKCGIVGLPNVGKSTLFNALTKAQVAAANYPFCTISPNIGVVPVPDPRLNAITLIAKPKHIVPAITEFVDIAGLVKGASKGEGLGNQFLANIRETHAIAHVVRCFDDSDVVHVSGRVRPEDDIEVINTELILADLEAVEKALQKQGKLIRSGDKQAVADQQVLEQMRAHLDQGLCARHFVCDEQPQILAQLNLITLKPVLYVANVAESNDMQNEYVEAVKVIAAKDKATVVTICATLEAEIAGFAEDEKLDFLREIGMTESGLDRLIRAGYGLLGLNTYFTAGVKEVRAWTIKCGTKAPQAASVIHTDFERGFICVEVIAYEDFIKYAGESGARDAGKLRVEGKNYIVQDGDIMHFRFNV